MTRRLLVGWLFSGWSAPLAVLWRAQHVRSIVWLAAEAAKPFAVDTEPPMRATLLRTTDDAHVLALAFHHIVVDAGSVPAVLSDIAAGYAGPRRPTSAIRGHRAMGGEPDRRVRRHGPGLVGDPAGRPATAAGRAHGPAAAPGGRHRRSRRAHPLLTSVLLKGPGITSWGVPRARGRWARSRQAHGLLGGQPTIRPSSGTPGSEARTSTTATRARRTSTRARTRRP
ncbi:condensation domain-containing protein [Actinomadura harenae]|uniref:Condensation domain-containing protein n=1 Tax=Actinomadura harenae TaxID=2483351 RepID=A0A3M2MB66_9ACTN|nr:hypothetical protein EBO15_07835 [Actinomadura harenae]